MSRDVRPERTRPRGALLGGAVLLVLAAPYSLVTLATENVLERSYNKFRTGTNTSETILTLANVRSSANQFHKMFVMKVDGKIEGSPLLASAVSIAGGTHNVVYVATMHNTVFDFDADTGTQLSARWTGEPRYWERFGQHQASWDYDSRDHSKPGAAPRISKGVSSSS